MLKVRLWQSIRTFSRIRHSSAKTLPASWPVPLACSAGEQHDPGPVAFAQFPVASVEDGVHCFSQRYVRSIVGGEVVPQFPNTANQWRVWITFRRQRRESGEELLAAICPDSPPSHQPSNRTHHLDVDQMGNNERLVAPRQVAPDGIGQGAVREEFDNHGGVQNDHRESRSSRITCAGLLLARMGFACWARSNHSRIVARSATSANSLLRKSERLMPSRAARDFRVPCTWSGTSRTWIIFDMLLAYNHVLHMSNSGPLIRLPPGPSVLLFRLRLSLGGRVGPRRFRLFEQLLGLSH